MHRVGRKRLPRVLGFLASLALTTLVALVPRVAAQGPIHHDTAGTIRLGAWVGASPNSPTGSLIGGVKGRQLYATGVRVSRVMYASQAMTLDFAVTALPLVVVTKNPIGIYSRDTLPDGSPTRSLDSTRLGSVYGVGLAPLGANLSLPGRGSVRFVFGCAIAAVVFAHPVPDGGAAQLNWMLEGGPALAFALGSLELSVGYRFLHLSHARGYNPGLNANLFHVGIARRLR